MNARTLNLTTDHIARIRRGAIAAAIDSDGAEAPICQAEADSYLTSGLPCTPEALVSADRLNHWPEGRS